jgi:hypothetical protein
MERLSFKEWQVLSDLEVLDSIPEDFEFSMARGELKTIKRSVDRIMKHLGGEGDLEAWVQSKITKANDYLNSVSNHMDGGEDDTKKEVKEAKCDCDCGKVPCVECGTDHHKKELKEEKCGDGMYYCKSSKKCKKIPKGHRVGKDGMLVKGVRWQDSDGDGKWYEPGDDVSEGSNPSFDINPKAKKGSERDKKLQNRADSGGVEGEIAAKMLQKKGKGPSLPGRQQDMRKKLKEGKYSDSETYVKGTAPVRATYGGKTDSFTKETYKKKSKKLNEGAVEDLEKGMETLKSITYDSIDGLMKKIAKDHDISTTKLHYMFKAKHDMTPDDWAEKNLKEEMSNWRQDLDEKCWKGYEKKGMKTMFGKRYPNCVKKEEVEQIQEKPGDGYLGPTMKVGGSEVGIPNPIRIAQDAADVSNTVNQAKVADINAVRRGSAKIQKTKNYHKDTSTASKTLFGLRHNPRAQEILRQNQSFEPQGEVIGEEGDNKVTPINKKKRMDAKKQATKDMSKEPYDTNTVRRRAKGQEILDNLLGKPPTTEEVVLEKRDGKSAKSKGYSLRDWFKGGGWVQAGGKYDGKPCAKQPGQTTKPFCRDADDRAAMTKDEREKRAAKKRREDPNPERKGKAKIVTEKAEEIRYCPKCKKPETRSDCRYGVDYWDANSKTIVAEKKDACYHKVKSRYSVWPSAYASGALVKCRKVGAKNWGNKTKKEGYEFSDWRDDFKPTEIQSFDIVKAEPLVDVNSITEPVQLATEDYQRLQSTGNVFCIMLTWRGQPYKVQLFFPGGSRPSREEVKGEVDKLYPGAVISHYYPAPTDPTQPIVVIQR